ncbi:MAG TPA: gluconate 2-dehydrogenase subunit 3 family protein [Vicinamibacterales bacterium]
MGSERTESVSPRPDADGAGPEGVARRTVLQTLLGGVGATLAFPAGLDAQAHPVHRHTAAGIAQAQERAAAVPYTPEFLDGHQLETLTVLSEAIVPGSRQAKVAEFLDQLLAVESSSSRRAFLSALGAFDMLAIERHNRAWKALTAAEQDALLQHASTAERGRGQDKTTIRDHFETLKGWISDAYYSSEPGMRELGWTGNVFHAELPGCTHPDGHRTG